MVGHRILRLVPQPLLVLTLVIGLLAPAMPAQAHWRRNAHCSPRTNLNYGLSDDAQWEGRNNGRSYALSASLARWEWTHLGGAASWQGGALISPDGDGFNMRWVYFPLEHPIDPLDPDPEPQGSYAEATCGPLPSVRNISFNILWYPEYESGGLHFEAVATHEFGHALGLSHSGERDNFDPPRDNPFPTMTTCLVHTPELLDHRNTIELDDHAALQFRNDITAGFGTANANSSFEPVSGYGTAKYWERIGSSTLVMPYPATGGVPNTGHYAVLNGTMTQSVTFSQGWDSRYKMSTYHRADGTGVSGGFVRLRVKVKHVDYSDIHIGCKDFKDVNGVPQNINQPTQGAAFVQEITVNCPDATTWTYCETATYNAAVGGTPDAVLLEVRVEELLTGTGTPKAQVDRVRLLVEV